MERKTIVVDASVAAKWFVEEEYSKEARTLRDAYADGLVDLAAPSLMPYEVINALKYSGEFGEDELKKIAEILENLQITLHQLTGETARKTIETSMRKGITIYDAAYVALAQQLDTILYTADPKLIKKTEDPKHVKHIAEYKLKKQTQA